MELIYADDRTVIGEVGYDPDRDCWLARSVHQQGRPTVFYSEARARGWVRQQHREQQT